MYNNKEFIGKTIQTIRKKANIRQSELAEQIGISEKHLSKIETGKNFPSLENFLKMAQILNFSLNDFGINLEKNISKDKQILIKIILSASDNDIKAYMEIITTLNKILKNKNL